MRRTPLLLVIAATTALSAPAHAQIRCGLTEEMQPGETLEQLAARCGTEPEEILRVNDARTAADLPEGRLKMPIVDQDDARDFLGKARNALRDAGQRIEDAATAAGKSASEYLADKPDLNRDLTEFGERIGLPGVNSAPSRGPEVSVENAGEGVVRVDVAGLPGQREVSISLRSGAELDQLASATTDESGRLSTDVEIPAGAASGGDVVLVVETVDGKVRLVSDPVAAR